MGEDSEAKLIFTYGTLKRGLPNHPLLSRLISTLDAVFIAPSTTLTPFPLVIGPNGVPFLINRVTSLGLLPLDELEGVTEGHYERLHVEVVGEDGGVVKAEAYFADQMFGREMWRSCGEVGIGEYTLEMSRAYVRRTEREGDGFVEDVWKFINSKPTSTV
ncbi:hypothetical protein LIER_25258 [Lithospermum erythrorhizon]|uniref:Gamma-glutamylcyclotransferase family protein n=1 Tax=Lithospermum erythrorhizon TaxID=34254 RepID=A0AAV3R3Z8_LITER